MIGGAFFRCDSEMGINSVTENTDSKANSRINFNNQTGAQANTPRQDTCLISPQATASGTIHVEK